MNLSINGGSNPAREGRGPLKVGNRASRIVAQHTLLHSLHRIQDVPDEALVAVTRRGEVDGCVGRPRNGIDIAVERGGCLVFERGDGRVPDADVEDNEFDAVHRDDGEEVRVEFSSAQAEEGRCFCAHVDDRRLLQGAEVKEAYDAVGAQRGVDVYAAHRKRSLDVPYSADCVDGEGPNFQ